MRDFIFRKKNVVSQEDCDKIIDFFESNPNSHLQGTVGSEEKLVPSDKISTEILLNVTHCNSLNEIIWKAMTQSVEEYKKIFPFLDSGVRRWEVNTIMKIQRYKPGEGYFVEHCENAGFSGESVGGDKRMMAWMIYLNDVRDGGYTEFPTQRKKFQPRRGDVLIWPAYWTHPHKGVTSKSQTKYIITGWYVYK